MPAILSLLWANKELVAKCLGIALIAFMLYWFLWHNPHRIKALETTIAEQSRQIELRDSALELQGAIRKAHDEITAKSDQNIRKIRTEPLRSDGVFILGGLLEPVR